MAIEFFLSGSHDETRRFMSAYAEEELRGYRRWRVARHVAKCEMCAAFYRSFLGALAALRQIGRRQPAAKPEFADSIVARIREGEALPEP